MQGSGPSGAELRNAALEKKKKNTKGIIIVQYPLHKALSAYRALKSNDDLEAKVVEGLWLICFTHNFTVLMVFINKKKEKTWMLICEIIFLDKKTKKLLSHFTVTYNFMLAHHTK